MVLDEHRELLADAIRIRAYEAALKEAVKPDDVVLDLGAGTGILGLLAARGGARRVYAVDDGGMLQLARDIARANHVGDRITHIHGSSTQIDLPEKADVVVADQIGPFGFEAGIVRCFSDARARLLKRGGLTVPSTLDLVVAPVTASDVWERIEFWRSSPAGFDLTPTHLVAMNTGYCVQLKAPQLLGPPSTLARLDLAVDVPPLVQADTTLTMDRPGLLHGIGGWFSAQLSPHVSMTSSPLVADRIQRSNVVFPIGTPVALPKGARVCVAMTIAIEPLIVSWRVHVDQANGAHEAVFAHSTWRGALITAEDLHRMRHDGRPRLSPWGAAIGVGALRRRPQRRRDREAASRTASDAVSVAGGRGALRVRGPDVVFHLGPGREYGCHV